MLSTLEIGNLPFTFLWTSTSIKALFANLRVKKCLIFSEHRTIEDASQALREAHFFTEGKFLSKGIQRLLIH